jgi:hypothetical protein
MLDGAASDSCGAGDRRSVFQKLTPLQITPPPMSCRPAALAETDCGATVMPSG